MNQKPDPVYAFFRNIDISGPSLISTETLNSEKDGENHYSIGVLVKMDKIDKNGKKFSKEEAYKLDPSKSLDEIVAEVMKQFPPDPRDKPLSKAE